MILFSDYTLRAGARQLFEMSICTLGSTVKKLLDEHCETVLKLFQEWPEEGRLAQVVCRKASSNLKSATGSMSLTSFNFLRSDRQTFQVKTKR